MKTVLYVIVFIVFVIAGHYVRDAVYKAARGQLIRKRTRRRDRR